MSGFMLNIESIFPVKEPYEYEPRMRFFAIREKLGMILCVQHISCKYCN